MTLCPRLASLKSDKNGCVCHKVDRKAQFPNQSPCLLSVCPHAPYCPEDLSEAQSVSATQLLKMYPWSPETYQIKTKFLRMPSEQSCFWLPSQEKWKHPHTDSWMHICSSPVPNSPNVYQLVNGRHSVAKQYDEISSAIIPTHATWPHLECIMLGERGQIQKATA